MIKCLFISLGFLLHISCLAQSDLFNNHNISIETFIEAHNKRDYKLMKKPIGFIGKVLISKRKLKEEFGSFYNKYGVLTIDTILYNSIYNGKVELKSKTHPEKRIFMSFNFNESGKLQGFGFGYPTFVYKKKKETDNDQQFRGQEIDSILNRLSINSSPKDFNGCILIAKNDSILYKKCKGYSDFKSRQALNDSSLFLLASCSKQFTATAIMMLQEKGKLKISDKVKLHLPNFPYDNITIAHILTHSSGLPSYFPLIRKYSDKSDFITNEGVLNLLIDHKQELRFTPNSVFEYSNTGYVMLSLIIESSSGLTFKKFVESNIFKPLNMNHSIVYNRRKEKELMPNYALGYVFSNQLNKYIIPDSLTKTKYVTYMDGITGDDGISSSITDLKIWLESLRNNTLINSKSFRAMSSSHILENGKKTNYGYGLMTKKGNGIEDLVYHTGSWPGYSTMILELVERKESIIILSNTDYSDLSFLADEIIYMLLE